MLNQRVQNLRKHRAAAIPSFNKQLKASIPYVAPLLIGAGLPLISKLLDPMTINPSFWETFLK